MNKDYAALSAELENNTYDGKTDVECLPLLPCVKSVGYVTINDAVNHDAKFGIKEIMTEIPIAVDAFVADNPAALDAAQVAGLKRSARVFREALLDGVLPRINVGDDTTQAALNALVGFGGPTTLYTQEMREDLEAMAEENVQKTFPWATARDIYLAREDKAGFYLGDEANELWDEFDIPQEDVNYMNGIAHGQQVGTEESPQTSCGHTINSQGRDLRVFVHYQNNMPYPVKAKIKLYESAAEGGAQHLESNYVLAHEYTITLQPGEPGASMIIRSSELDRYVRTKVTLDANVAATVTMKTAISR